MEKGDPDGPKIAFLYIIKTLSVDPFLPGVNIRQTLLITQMMDLLHMYQGIRLGSPAHTAGGLSSLCTRVFEKSSTFLSSFDTFLREPITQLAFPPGGYWLV